MASLAEKGTRVNIGRYEPSNPPGVLRLLLKAALTMRRPVEIVWINAEDEPCGGVVGVVAMGREWVRIATENGVEKTLSLWDCVEAVLLGSEAAASAGTAPPCEDDTRWPWPMPMPGIITGGGEP